MPGVVVRFKDIAGDKESAIPPRTPNALRRGNQSAPRLAQSGRHLSSIASVEELQTKLSHFSHAEHGDERSLAAAHLQRTRESGVHARGWWYAERPSGQLPDDLERLGDSLGAHPEGWQPSKTQRRLVRTWAWMRHSPHAPQRLVRFVDRNFERLAPLILPLLIVDILRGAVSRCKTQKTVVHPTAHHH